MKNKNRKYRKKYKKLLPHARLTIKASLRRDVETATTTSTPGQGRTQTASLKALRNGYTAATIHAEMEKLAMTVDAIAISNLKLSMAHSLID